MRVVIPCCGTACTLRLSLPGAYFEVTGSALSAVLKMNRTIDDYFADSVTGRQVEYTGYWNVGQTCYGCAIHPDANKAYAGTWHDVTSNYPNTSIADYLTIQFKDGEPAGTYTHFPNPDDAQFIYNLNVFSQTELENAEHTLVMTAIQGAQPSYLLFDWVQYT
ncbi:hypothetical protein C8Q72DRAFT_791036 [Fomitopsis betulina]|nr:hypothetical protein C8Q72DRAFT_791036 [Fomitopsis betulina]